MGLNYTPGAFQKAFTLETKENIEKSGDVPGGDNPSMHSVVVRALKSNLGPIYIGNAADTVDTTHGFPLEPNDSVSLDIESLGTLAGFATKAGDKVAVLFVGP